MPESVKRKTQFPYALPIQTRPENGLATRTLPSEPARNYKGQRCFQRVWACKLYGVRASCVCVADGGLSGLPPGAAITPLRGFPRQPQRK